MPVRIFITSLFLMMVSVLLLACSEQVTPDPIFASENASNTSPAASPEAPKATPRATSTETATPPPLLTSTHTPPPTATTTPTELSFNITGRVCFPGERIPPMTAYFEETSAGTVVELPIAENQDFYEIKLPSGTYIAYIWLPDFSQGGLYSHAVPCGLNGGCDDHGVQPFAVQESEILEEIDLCDWYAGPFNVPYPPGVDKEDFTGSLSGRITYPGDTPVELRVVAYSTETGYWYWVNAQPGQPFYGINNLPPGTYHVVAYDPQGRAGGYATGGHQLIDVLVIAGELAEGADITDWGAPDDAFPPDPTR